MECDDMQDYLGYKWLVEHADIPWDEREFFLVGAKSLQGRLGITEDIDIRKWERLMSRRTKYVKIKVGHRFRVDMTGDIYLKLVNDSKKVKQKGKQRGKLSFGKAINTVTGKVHSFVGADIVYRANQKKGVRI